MSPCIYSTPALFVWLFLHQCIQGSAVEYIPRDKALLVQPSGQIARTETRADAVEPQVPSKIFPLMRSIAVNADVLPGAALAEADAEYNPRQSNGGGGGSGGNAASSDPYYSSGYAASHGDGSAPGGPPSASHATSNAGIAVGVSNPQSSAMAGTSRHGPHDSCQIPMWSEADYVCSNHVDADDIWKDADDIKRKIVENKGECVVACPKGQSWMTPDMGTMTCSKGSWEDAKGNEVKQINCKTAYSVYVVVLVFLLLVAGAGYGYNHHQKQKQAQMEHDAGHLHEEQEHHHEHHEEHDDVHHDNREQHL